MPVLSETGYSTSVVKPSGMACNCMRDEREVTSCCNKLPKCRKRRRSDPGAPNVGVIGLGYVGLPLAVDYAQVGFQITGIDLDETKTARINTGDSYVADASSSVLNALVENGRLRATTELSAISNFDTVDICVPAPLRKTKDPDMSFIVAACEEIARYLHTGMLVILESTTYRYCRRISIAYAGEVRPESRDGFFLCFSPERVDPGNQLFQTKNIPKVVGGTTSAACIELANFFIPGR
jgi:UDP-N-acetyl-D-glucosamine dehydrogenase